MTPLLTRHELARLLHKSPTEVAKLVTKPGFPSPVDVLEGYFRWRKSEVEAWITSSVLLEVPR